LIILKNKHVSKLNTSGKDQGHQLLASEANYRALFEHVPDGILIADFHNYYLDANPSMCELLGYGLDELVGMHASQIVSELELEHLEPELNATNFLDEGMRQWKLRRKDGTFFEAEVYISHMPDGNLLGIVRDITLIKSREHEISRLAILYEALSQVNQSIVLMSTREALFQSICRTLVELGGFSMAWVGWHDPALRRIIPMATCGDHNDYIKNISIFTDERPEGLGPTGVAFRTGRPYVCNNMQNDPITLPWRAEITKRGFRASAVFLIRERGKVSGTLTVYADTDYFFQNKEIALLEEAALNISFGLDNLLREQESLQANLIANSERQFSNTMIDSMPGIMYFYDMQGKFLRWNKNFEVVSGFSCDEIANKHPLDFFEDRYKPLLMEKINEVFDLGESSVEAPFLSKDGKTTQYFFTGRKVVFNNLDCLVGVGIDITELNQTELLLAENELKYRELVENANSIILRWNSEGKITFLNEYGQHYFGYSLEEIMGQDVVGSIVPPRDTAGNDMHPLMQQIRSNPAAFEQNINQNIRRNGELVWIAWTNKCVFDKDGTIIEVLSIGSDITKERHAEETIRELNTNLEHRVIERTQELNAALIRAEAADKIKSAFLATMSHELRTPLNSIIGFTGIILQGLAGPLNTEQSKQLGMVRVSARHLLELINDVLDISKIEAGQLEVKLEIFDLQDSLQRVMSIVKPIAEKKGLVLKQVIPEDIGHINNDRRRFEQILINLLNNAIKFTDQGFVTLSVEYQIEQSTSARTWIKFKIKDTGIGIKAKDIQNLFQAFHQIDTGLSRLHEGTGLGLAICRRLSMLMGGEISVNSEWSKGSEFIFKLPLDINKVSA
jgi:PAS domain S-box-containing protein